METLRQENKRLKQEIERLKKEDAILKETVFELTERELQLDWQLAEMRAKQKDLQ